MNNKEIGAARLRILRRASSQLVHVALVALGTGTLVSCNQAQNQAPMLGSVPAQYTATDKALAVRLPFDDDEPATVVFEVESDNEAVVAAGSVAVTGEALDRVLEVGSAPGTTGTVELTVTATDDEALTDSTTFTVRVVAPFSHQSDTLHASDAAAGERYGAAVAVSQAPGVPPLVMVGAPGGDSAAYDEAGVVHVLSPAGSAWQEVAVLAAPDGYNGATFGTSLAASAEYLVVGDDANNELGHYAGAVYVFERQSDAWGEPVKLLASDGLFTASFGATVAVSGDYLVVGAPFDDGFADNGGAAYVFERIDGAWTEVAKLTAPDGLAGDQFGTGVSIAGTHVLVGAPYHDDVAVDAGAVYVYSRSSGSWQQVDEITASDAEASEWFGIAVAMTSDNAVVGAQGEDDIGPNGGAAYVLDRAGDTFTESEKLIASDSFGVDQFGAGVAIHGTTLLVGAYREDDQAANAGAVYVFQQQVGGWQEELKLYANDGAVEDFLGRALAMGPGLIVMGTDGSDAAGVDSGSAYVVVW